MRINLYNKRTDNPRLEGKELKDGRISLSLLTTLGYEYDRTALTASGNVKKRIKRKREKTGLYLFSTPRTREERAHNDEAVRLACKLRDERNQQRLEDKEGYRLQLEAPDMLDFFQSEVDSYKGASQRVIACALTNFRKFLTESEKYNIFATRLEAKQITKDMMQEFAHYIEDNHKGDGVATYWKRFKQLINAAVDKGYMKKSPCHGVKIAYAENELKKGILSQEEIGKLFATHYIGENPNIRRAFAFTLCSGIRPCDLRKLTYGNIDFANKLMTFTQSKVKGHSKSAVNTIPLTDNLLGLIGEKPEAAKDTDLIFKLPTEAMCNKALRHWTKRAGIIKHITWYCARHSFATNILLNGNDIKTVSALLGHSTLKNTQKYLHAVDAMKVKALNSLAAIDVASV